MLKASDREKLEKRVDNILAEIFTNAKEKIQTSSSRKQVLDQVVTSTVNRLTPESKMLLSSLYNLLEADTLQKDLYKDETVKASFYAMDIRSDFNKRFIFEVPKNVNYEESNDQVKRWTSSGSVVVAGGVISIVMKSVVPVGIAAIIAGIMAVLLNGNTNASSMSTVDLVRQYLDNVRKTLLQWLQAIEKNYDEKVNAFEERFTNE